MKVMLSMILAASLVLGGIMLVGPARSGEVLIDCIMLTPHAPIRINNNTDFVTMGLNGSGTPGDPWIMENLEINGTGAGYCIYVGNTTEHFTLRDSRLHNASGVTAPPYVRNSGVSLYNVSNGLLHNITITDCQDGIYLSHGSNNITASWNTASGNDRWGIILDAGSNDNILVNNTATGNGEVGMYLYMSKRNSLGFNNVSFNSFHGIWLHSSSNNSLFNCTVVGNLNAGIYLYQNSNNNSVIASRIHENDFGIRLQDSTGNRIFHNEIVNNTYQSRDNIGFNSWDDGYPSGGNYWSDYTGSDAFNGPNQNVPGSDGIGDVPYNITGGDSRDRYPLMAPFVGQLPGETVPPFALSWSPNGTAEPTDVPIVITWNETMDWASVEAAFEYTDGTTNWTSANGSWTHVGNVSTFTPTLPFAYKTHYVVTVNSSASDIIGNMLDQNRNGTGGEWPADILTWGFTTTDEAPYVVSTQPADGQIGVDPSKPFKIIFSESMNRTSVESAFTFTDGTEEWNVTNGVGYWNALFTEFTFSPSTALELNTTFQVSLNGTLAKDLGGKGLKYGDYSWNFTTWLQPPAPQIITTYPPDGAFNVNVNTYINIAFDNEMDPVSVENAFSYTDGAGVWTVADGMFDWFSENTLFSFQPTVALGFNTEYRVKVSSAATSVYGVSLDGNGNGIPEQNDNYTFMFTTTVEPPKVISHYPGSGQMNLPTDLAAIYINFSKVMSLPSVTSAISISPNIPFTTSFSGGGRNLTIVLTGTLLEGTEYRVTVLGTAMDIGGTKLDGNGDGWPGDRFSFNFFTKGLVIPTKPTITAIFPLNNATIPVDSFYVAVTFSVPMNRTSVESAFTFRSANAIVNGTIQWSVSNKSFRFTPAETLAYNTTYIVKLAGTAKSMEGLAMGNASSWQYLTEPAEEAPPLMNWVLYGVILMLLGLTIVLYMANRSLRRDLKRTRVKLKRLKREMGIKDDVPEKPDEVEKAAVQPEEEFLEKVVPELDDTMEIPDN